MRRFFRENGLSLVLFWMFFLTFIVGQTLVGHREYNQEQEEHGGEQVPFSAYLRTGHFLEATAENWESRSSSRCSSTCS